MNAEDLLRSLKSMLDGTLPNESLAAFRGFKAARPPQQHSLLDVGFDLFLSGRLVFAAERLIVVALVHGIRTAADWQEKARAVLETKGKVVVVPIGYGYQDLVSFLGPWRKGAIERVTRELRDLQRLHLNSDLVVLAHSFGTYIVSKILQEAPDIRISRLLLCGSVIPSEYRWDQLPHTFTNQTCVNEVGTRDYWPVIARIASLGYGGSGSFGFKTARVWDRYFDYGHSDFFTELHLDTFWRPFILTGQVIASPWDAKRPRPSLMLSLLGGIPMIKVFLLLVLASVGALLYWISTRI